MRLSPAALAALACAIGASACSHPPAISAATIANRACPPEASRYCDQAQKVMSTYLRSYATTGSQIANGETVMRELGDDTAFGGQGMTWHDACAVEMIVDYYAATGDATYLPIVKAYRSFDALDDFGGGGFSHRSNEFNDDKLWWALAFIHAFERMPDHDALFLRKAEAIFQDVCGQWNLHPGCGGGITQQDSGTYENTITNALFFQTAVKLYFDDPLDDAGVGTVTQTKAACALASPLTAYPGPLARPADTGASGALSHQFENDYLGWALAEYEWLKPMTDPSALKSGPLPDGIAPAPACTPGGNHWTYNSGPILGALLDLSDVRDPLPDPPEAVLEQAWEIAGEAMTYFSKDGTPALTEHDNPTCDGNTDCPEFKGLFVRYLGRLAHGSPPSLTSARALGFLARNADAIWANRLAATVPVSCSTQFLFFYGCAETSGVSLPLDWNAPPGALAGQNYEAAMTSGLDGLIAAIPMVRRPWAPAKERSR